MKLIGFFFLLATITACDPYGFGFKMNPAYVLNEAFKSILNQSPEDFIDVTGKEALCIYGNDVGMLYLKEKLSINTEDMEIIPKLVENSSRYTDIPSFVDFWSYYTESYEVDISNKSTKSELLKVLVECHYGFEGEKNVKYQKLKVKKYKRKECRLIKIMPFNFESLSLSEQCEALHVNYKSKSKSQAH